MGGKVLNISTSKDIWAKICKNTFHMFVNARLTQDRICVICHKMHSLYPAAMHSGSVHQYNSMEYKQHPLFLI